MTCFVQVFAIVLIMIMIAGMIIVRHLEKVQWNNGICKESGLPWDWFDTDSQGGRMYTDHHGNFCDISYAVDCNYQPKDNTEH